MARTLALILFGILGFGWGFLAIDAAKHGAYAVAVIPALPALGVVAVLIGVWKGKIK